MMPRAGFAFLDESFKKNIRRALLKAMAIPGFQVPFCWRETPFFCGGGSGAIQLAVSILGRTDLLRLIDHGSDETLITLRIKDIFMQAAEIRMTEITGEATMILSRHRIPDPPLKEGQIVIYPAPAPEPLRFIEPRRSETVIMHAFQEYGAAYLRLYENRVRHRQGLFAFGCPVLVHGRYLMSPSPVPESDNSRLNRSPAIHLFSSGRERCVFCVPPYTEVSALGFDDDCSPGDQP